MAITRFQDVTQAALDVVLSGLEAPEFSFQTFFPTRYTSTLTWESLQSDGNLSVSADVIAHDSSANLKSRPDTTIQQGEIPKISILNRVQEKVLHDYFALQNNPRGLEDEIFRIIFGDVRRGYEGVHMRLEQLGMQALSTGVAETTAANNVGIPFKATYAIPAGNFNGVVTVWSNAGTANPIKDLNDKVAYAKSQGQTISQILMDRDTFNQLRNATATKELYSGYVGLSVGRLAPTLDNINLLLSGEGLPPIKIVESTINVEAADGTVTPLTPWSASKVTLLASATAGVTQWTQTAEEKGGEEIAGKNSISSNRDIVRLTRWNEFNPYRILTKGEGVAFPVLNNVKGIFLMNTNNATTWS